MNFKPVTVFDVVRLIDLQAIGQTAFSILFASPVEHTPDSEFLAELQVQTSRELDVIDAAQLAPIALIERLQTSNAPVIFVSGLKGWSDASFASLDVNRGGLEAGKFVVFRMAPSTAARFLGRAPNLRSSIGTHLFALAPDLSFMTEEEVADRLGQLRAHYGMTDNEVIERAEKGTLQSEPHFIEWLVLLERAELAQ